MFATVSLLMLFVVSISALGPEGRNVCPHEREEQFTAQESYKVKCGFLKLKRCTRHRTVTRTRRVTDYKCCPGWATPDNVHCSVAVCFGQLAGTCRNGGRCIGPNVCTCRPGFSKPRCSDIDECEADFGGCHHICDNQPGSYSCSCVRGYELQADRKTCKPRCFEQPVDTCQNGGTCVSPNRCICATGFSPPRCDDVNECDNDNGGCSQTCTNSVGSFRCSCHKGYGLVGTSDCKPIRVV